MDAPPSLHPTDQTLQDYGAGALSPSSAESLKAHLRSCPACRKRVAGSERAGRVSPGPAHPDPGPADDPPFRLDDGLPYDIVRELGRGGMGVVYLARNRMMGRDEVLKVVAHHMIDRKQVMDRFLREIRSAARLSHPNIVTAYSAFHSGRSLVLAMEYVEGLDLARLVKAKGPLQVDQACYFIRQAAMGLQHAHEQGMIHRDIKPGNLMLVRRGGRATVKVLDFGLAKATREDAADTGLTHEGQMLGTPDYAAPEQTLDAQKADIRADIYSLGCTLYHLLTGAAPFRGSSLYETLVAHQSRDARPLDAVRPDVPAGLAAVVARMMAKDPGERFQTPAEVARALTPYYRPSVDRGSGSGDHTPVATPPAATPTPAIPRTVLEDRGPSKPAAGSAPWRVMVDTSGKGHPARPRRVHPMLVGGVALAALLALGGGFLAYTASRRDGGAAGRAGAVARVDPAKAKADDQGARSAPPPDPAPAPPAPPEPPPFRSQAPRARDKAVPKAPTKKRDVRATPPPATVAAVRPVVRNAAPEVVGPGGVDIRRVKTRPGVPKLVDDGATLPILDFWPPLTPDDLSEWRVGDPAAIKMNAKGLVLNAGKGGNFLLTRRADYRKCSILVSLSAAPGTEAFVALHAGASPDGWQALTAKVKEGSGKVRVGGATLDFADAEAGKAPTDQRPGKAFLVKFLVELDGPTRVLVNGKAVGPALVARGRVGAAGLFVKSGSVVLQSIRVDE